MSNVAAKVRAEKERHPADYCPDPRCLWRVETRGGRKPCPKHMGDHIDADLRAARRQAIAQLGEFEWWFERTTDPLFDESDKGGWR